MSQRKTSTTNHVVLPTHFVAMSSDLILNKIENIWHLKLIYYQSAQKKRAVTV